MKHLKSTFKYTGVLLAMITVLAIISSCNDDDNDDAPVISLESPLDHSHFNNGDEIHFHGNVTDDGTVKHVTIKVWEEDDTNNILFNVDVHPDAASFHVDTGFTVATTDTTEYVFKVVAEDDAGHITETPADQHVHINEQ